MTKPKSIVAIAGDAGGASALAPVIGRLRSLGRAVTALAYRQACSVWADRQVTCSPVDERTVKEDACRLLQETRASLLLAGTSFNGVDLEKRFVAAARSVGIGSISLLDFWSNYRVRFADEEGRLTCVPDRIAVMDEFARQEMIADGFDAQRIVVTGQPAFDGLAASQKRSRAELRAQLQVGENDRLVLFASQPLAELFGEDDRNSLYPGYSQRTVLRSLVAALDAVAQCTTNPIVLLVRPHPREQLEHFAITARNVRVMVRADQDRLEAVRAADLVCGMSSVLLVEACLLGCAVLSVQPNLRFPDSLPTNRCGASQAVYKAEEIVPTLHRLLIERGATAKLAERSARLRVERNATGRVVSVIDECFRTLSLVLERAP